MHRLARELALRTDRGLEYLYEQFKELCNEKEIDRKLTILRTPHKNSVAKRKKRTLL